MRLNIGGDVKRQSDVKIIREFVLFVVSKYINSKDLAKLKIRLAFVEPSTMDVDDANELREFSAWMQSYDRYTHFITIDSTLLPKSKPKSLAQLKDVLASIGHELVHVKQYVNCEMRDYANRDVWFKGKRYKDWEDMKSYYASPWEVEAYGAEYELYNLYNHFYYNK